MASALLSHSLGSKTVGSYSRTTIMFDDVFASHMVLQRGPSRSAVYGEVATRDGVTPTVTVLLRPMSARSSGRNSVASVSVAKANTTMDGPRSWYWKVLLDPVTSSAAHEIIVTAAGAQPAKISHVVFGDVWVCAGQSNSRHPLEFTFGFENTTKAVMAGKYANIRIATMWLQSVLGAPTSKGNRWHTGRHAQLARMNDSSSFGLGDFCGSCWYFAQELSERFMHAGLKPPQLGLICLSSDGSKLEQWVPPGTLQRQCAHTLVPERDEGALYGARVRPLTSFSIKGWLWHQGEHNLVREGVSGNSRGGYGYGCELPTLIAMWRQQWSVVENTTEPLAPFGVVTLSPRASWMGGADYGSLRWAQTANYGRLPNPAMPNTFLAHAYDLADPWSVQDHCYWVDCCGPQHGCTHHSCARGGAFNAAKCQAGLRERGLGGAGADVCDPYCRSRGSTPPYMPSMGGLHPRLKKPIGHRLATAAARLVYDVGTHAAIGPTIAGCRVTGGSPVSTASTTRPSREAAATPRILVLAFDSALLGQEALVLQPPRHERGSMLQVLTHEPDFCVQRLQRCRATANSTRIGMPGPPRGGSVRGELGKLLGGGNADPFVDPIGCNPTDREWFCPSALTPVGVDSRRVEKRLRDYTPVSGIYSSYLPPPPQGAGTWITLNMTLTSAYEISVDLAPLRGTPIFGVRYAWGVRGSERDESGGIIKEEPLCCAANDDALISIAKPCEPASCPIMASGGLPANPFLVRVVNNTCRCLPPQTCDGDQNFM